MGLMMIGTRKLSLKLTITLLLLFFSNSYFIETFLSSAKPTHNTTSLNSKWTWDEPYLDGSFESLWSICPVYSYSIFNRESATNQSFSLQFLNNEDYLFVAINWWGDNNIGQMDSLRLYLDENHDGILLMGAEDYRSLSWSSGSLNLVDGYYGSGSWAIDSNQNGSFAGSISTTNFEIKIPIGNNAEGTDLNSTFAGEIVGFNVIATDSDWIPGQGYQYTATEIYGNDTSPTTWTNLELAHEPDLDFIVNLDPSSMILEVGEAFYVTCFLSNNANSTGIVHYLNITIILPKGIILAPSVENSQYLDDLYIASSYSSGYNSTFIWPLITNETGEYIIDILIDGVGIPQQTNSTQVRIISPFPKIHMISPSSGEVITGVFLLQISISYQASVLITQYSLNNRFTWLNLTWNSTSSFYEELIDSQDVESNYLTIRAVDDLNRMTILKIQISGSQVTSQTTTLTIDNTPPEIIVLNPLNSSVINGLVTFQLSVIDDAGVNNVEFRVDQESWILMTRDAQSGYYVYDVDTLAFADGPHTLTFRASDSLGNIHSSLAIIEYRISILNPESSSSATKKPTTDTSAASSGYLMIPGIFLLIFYSYYKKKRS
jgi:hypothetical protein